MKFTGQLILPQIDITATLAKWHAYLIERLAQAAFVWVDAAEGAIPVWSGASKATFLQLAHAVGFEIAIAPSATAPYDGTGLGVSHSTGQLGPIDAGRGLYLFTYSTDLERLVSNEYADMNALFGFHLINPGPYHFQDKALAAFKIEIANVALPPIVYAKRSVQV